ARAERKTTGMSRVSVSAASCSATLQPSTPGIITSRRTSDGRFRLTSSSASAPSFASLTASPSPSRLTRQMVRIARSSSTRRTRGAGSAGRPAPAPLPGSGRCRTRLRHVPGAECGDAGAEGGVVLPPVAVAAAPHLVDPPLGNPGAELRLVVHDGHLREVLRAPAGPLQAAGEIRLLRVDEELLVEQADLVER